MTYQPSPASQRAADEAAALIAAESAAPVTPEPLVQPETLTPAAMNVLIALAGFAVGVLATWLVPVIRSWL